MAKIRLFYVSNIKNELAYVNHQQYIEDKKKYSYFRYSDIPNYEIRVLIIEEMFNLKDAAKYSYNDNENSDDSDNISDNESDSENKLDNSENIEIESNYNIEELIQQYLLNDELIGDTL
ncbi:hypothetical protein RclHR1_06190003 [Rhizophagus clarus]|uniref:Uncharacterized protein n=1 Tax=Rhizophagus clarus TaxID=94130 RepID=A0A2Z6RRQ4_9GLOM|nr:hypothetical protein RclHR1_06190003 [Rhizophagus clarus]GES84122.1 hypothetical protein GLOIN_2v1778495 [Rhizophagus clarus]